MKPWKIESIIRQGPYNYALVKGHPFVENSIGRLLDRDEVVHHINGNGRDNRIENLVLMKRSEHIRRHNLKNGRAFVYIRCPSCGTEFVKERSRTYEKGERTNEKES